VTAVTTTELEAAVPPPVTEPDNEPAPKSISAEPADDDGKGPGRPSPKPIVADELKRLKKDGAKILKDAKLTKGKKMKLWEHLAKVCEDKGYDIEPKSTGSLIRRNKMLPT
jgi:hypothetical protein